MMKRRNIFILLSFMALALLACSGNGKTSSSKLSSSSSSSTITSKTIPPHEHKYNFDSFVWDFAPHNFTAKAKLICEDDPTYTLLEDAETRMVRHNLPTCTEQGEYIYEARYQDRKSVIHVEKQIEYEPSLGGHVWLEPTWKWGYANSYVDVTFVCERDATHTFSTRIEREDMEENVLVEPTCSTRGTLELVASVTLDDKNYTTTKEESIPEKGEHTLDDYGFCVECHNYFGDTSQTCNSEITIENPIQGKKYFFALPAVNHHRYYDVYKSNLEDGDFTFFYFDCGERIITDLFFMTIDNFDDSLLYVVVTPSYSSDVASFIVESHHLFDFTGLCLGDQYYEKNEIEVGQKVDINLEPKCENYRFPLCEGHKYQILTNINLQSLRYFYYNKFGLEEIYPDADNCFDCPDDSVEGHIYIVLTTLETISGGYLQVIYKSHPVNEFGLCVEHNYYVGEEIIAGTYYLNYSLDEGEENYFRLPMINGHSYELVDNFGVQDYDYFKAFILTEEGPTKVDLGKDNYLEGSIDSYLYLVFIAELPIVDKEFITNEYHQYQFGYCIACEDYIGETVNINETVPSFSIESGERVYFRVAYSQLTYNEVYEGYELDYSCSKQFMVDVFYRFEDEWQPSPEIEYHKYIINESGIDYIYIVLTNTTTLDINNIDDLVFTTLS